MNVKHINRVKHKTESHWVGNGFPVNTLFSYHSDAHEISPFLLLDYAGPAEFSPASNPRGVEQHPHRGFETVTVVYQGEVEHKDSAGNSGKIGSGDVQWMTAARGILHEEMHSRDFTQKGGTLEMIQLWVNLPAKHKMDAPRYQGILSRDIPIAPLVDNAGQVRVIAGEFEGIAGAASTFSPVNMWDVRLNAESKTTFDIPDGFTTALLVLKGVVKINDSESLSEKEIALFERKGETITVEATRESILLLLSGEPIDEPIAGYGPFVMNTQEEIKQAVKDFQSGSF